MEPMISRVCVKEPISLDEFRNNSDKWLESNQENEDFDYQSICKRETKRSTDIKLKRVDFILKKSHYYFEYLYFLNAHSSYWNSDCLVHFFLKLINEN